MAFEVYLEIQTLLLHSHSGVSHQLGLNSFDSDGSYPYRGKRNADKSFEPLFDIEGIFLFN